MNDHLAGANGLAIGRSRQGRAQGQQNIALRQPAMGRQGRCPTARAECEGMTFIKGGLARHGTIYRRRGQLGQFLQGGRGARKQHPGTGPNHRLPGGDQGGCSGGNIAAFGRLAGQLWGLVIPRLLRHFLGADIPRQLHNHGARRTVAQGIKSPPHDIADLAGGIDRLHLLGPALIFLHGGEIWPHGYLVEVVAAQHDQDWNIIRISLGQPAHGVFRPRLGLHRDHAETLAVADTAIAVRRHHRAALVTKGDGPDTFPRGGRDQGIGGKTG